MKNKSKNLKITTDNLSKIGNNQEKNKRWWEALPMTYAKWDSKERIPKTKDKVIQVGNNVRVFCYITEK